MNTQFKPEWFHNKTSYEAFLYALALVDKIKQAQSEGAIIYDEGEVLYGEWIVSYDPDEPSILLRKGNCGWYYLGEQWDTRTGKIYCTKKEVKEAFEGIYWVYPKDFHKLF